ncbi:MAG: hypothetical protein KJ063_25510, partial [Anaerolineae bacterium]|nr:hypothetical protein [Anaerolineae bacterium]
FYLPGIGRFASADTIVPDVTNPQNYNRYSYVLNQPIIGTDPDGHCYPICTAIAGGIIGGFVTGVTYYVTTPAAERNWADASLAVGTGVVAGALIGTGVGIVATGAVTVAAGTGASVTAASAMLISAGTGTIVAAETQMIMNGFTGNSFDRTDFAINTIGATAEGAIAPGLGPSRSILASGTIGASQSILSNALHGETINGQEALISGLLGLGSATVGSVVEGASSIGSQPISRGIQPIDFTWQNVQDPILRSWIGNAAAKNSAFASSRTIIRDVVYGIGIKMIQEELP